MYFFSSAASRIAAIFAIIFVLVGCEDSAVYKKTVYDQGLAGETKASDGEFSPNENQSDESINALSDLLPGESASDADDSANSGSDSSADDENLADDSNNSDDSANNQELMTVKQTFTQNSSNSKPLDILWVIDNSGSMLNEQEDLARNFDMFISDFVDDGIDFKMGITTTDGRAAYDGRMIGDYSDRLNSIEASADKANFISMFQNDIKAGTNGSGREKGLQTSRSFLQRYQDSFFRKDAVLAIVVVSDEEDSSEADVKEYVEYFQSLKEKASMVKFYSIVTKKRTHWATTVGKRYIEASNLTGGTSSEIKDDFYQTLEHMGQNLLNLLDSFLLDKTPYNNQVKVTVNGQVIETGFQYDATSKSIKFDADQLPPEGSKIEVEYQVIK